MYKFPIGVIVDSFRLPIPEAVKKAREIGATALQVYSTSGEMAPENMNEEKIRAFNKLVSDNGLTVSALVGDIGGFAIVENNAANVEKSKRIMDLALKLNCDVVTTHIGVIPDSQNDPMFRVYQEVCDELGEYGDKIGAHFAIETGPETSLTLFNFLETLNSKGVGVNYDPANLIMVTGDDAVQGVHILKDYIWHTHAKDGVRIKPVDPHAVYHGGTNLNMDDYFQEVPLGKGQVDWPNYLKALEDIGYRGPLTIERETGDQPIEDIRLAVEFLKAATGQ